ncbi:sensor histidine kinase [Nonomuraea spiralis]|uniref:histidine kinase n=1 Tax=Nonomuraea spiralis TaxID=46182 RepID=A0ABV5IXP6_9ACTN|nr:histidine kinase [Nonomuraea spiralis]GGT35725.1 two-component sensor histidine kinase [Nonomuraea spiralis]
MHDLIEHPPDRAGPALRYLVAAVPVLLSGLLLIARTDPPPTPLLIDLGIGVLALPLLLLRHRLPWQLALVTAVLTAVSLAAVGVAAVAYASLCVRGRWRQVAPVAVVFWLSQVVYSRWQGTVAYMVLYGAVTALAVGALTVFALYVRGRRELAAARRAAELAEQRQRVRQARLGERLKIAQEMHDVLAHRISLLAMLAGGLAHRRDLPAAETREVALAIQENAHQSLTELRAVLGTLRHDGDGTEPPQPTLAHLDALFEEVRAAGQRVEVDDTIDGRERLPARTGRHAYRIVQEALTNARKHAPGTRVTAELTGGPGDGLRIRVSNPAPYGTSPGPGGRLGLVGLAERTRMAGGAISHELHDGRFVLDARLPWEA